MSRMVSLDDLIALSGERSPSGIPLDLLATAVALSRELSGLSDGLLDHFVEEARRAGCSWAQIGEVLGVSKQAAQQRFAGRWLGRVMGRGKRGARAAWAGYTDRARRVVELAQEEARRLDHNYVGTEHLLLGILREPRAVGAKALEAMGVSLARIRDRVEAKIGRGERSAVRLPIPFTPRAKKALHTSVGEAKSIGHNYVGTEHFLLALLGIGESVAAEILRELGLDKERVRQEILRLLAA